MRPPRAIGRWISARRSRRSCGRERAVAEKVAFVTGASGGIGRATALAFAREGASVVVADVAAEGNRETARMIEQGSGRALVVTCDVTRSEAIDAALRATVEEFGRLDIAFNNAGIEQPIKPAAEISDDEWARKSCKSASSGAAANPHLCADHGRLAGIPQTNWKPFAAELSTYEARERVGAGS